MKLVSFLFFTLLSWTALSAFDGAKINLELFEESARAELAANGLEMAGNTFLQDGMLPDNMTPEEIYEDLAELHYVSTNSISNYSVVYTLNLSTGDTELNFLSLTDKSRKQSSVGMVMNFDSKVDLAKVKSDLNKRYPSVGCVKIGSSLNIFVKDYAFFAEVGSALAYLETTYSIKGSYFNERFNAFSQPVFGLLQPLSQSIVDLDILRDIVPMAVSEGINFETSTSLIPLEMKP
jgi:hypothetical protein